MCIKKTTDCVEPSNIAAASRVIMIVAGEMSGDLLGAALAQALQAQAPHIRLCGMGGSAMQQAGVELLVDSTALAVVGAWEVVKHLSAIRAAMKTLIAALQTQSHPLLVLIDYPGFNLRLAARAKQLGVQVVYYVSPQIWAWRYGRIRTIRRCVDHMLVLFPFEKKLYDSEGVRATCVGHPLIERITPTLSREAAQQLFGLDAQRPVVALCPGSREQEISKFLPVLRDTIALVARALPQVQFILPLSPNIPLASVQAVLPAEVKVVVGQNADVFLVSDAAIAVSGTITLEIALHGVPLLVIYAAAWLTYWMAKRLIKIPYIGLCNVVAEKEVARELIQADACPTEIAAETLRLLQDQSYRQLRCEQLQAFRALLGAPGASMRAAEAVLQALGAVDSLMQSGEREKAL